MARKRAPADQEEADLSFKFKPILGIQPRIYVPAAFAASLSALLFFLLVFPGLSNPGARVSFDSLPRGAAVYVDGTWLGATPFQAYVKAGKRELRMKKAGYAELVSSQEVPWRLLGSLFFPAELVFTKSLTAPDKAAILVSAFEEHSRWSLSPQPTVLYQHPPVLSETAQDQVIQQAASGTLATGSRELLEKYQERALSSVDSPALFAEFLKTTGYISSGPVFSAQGLVKVVTFFIRAQKKYRFFAVWLANIVPEKLAATIVESKWYKASLAAATNETAKLPATPAPRAAGGAFSLRGNEFVAVPAGSFRMGDTSSTEPDAPFAGLVRAASVSAFYLKRTEVSQAEFAAFLEENPSWKKENSQALIAQGLVDANYLAEFAPSAPEKRNEPLRFVSYPAASAYCEWLGRLNGDFRFFLPDEKQWEWAARLDAPAFAPSRAANPPPAGAQAAGRLGLRGMLGGVWEWTSGWFGPAGGVFDDPELGALFPGAERTVRGGSWINQDAGRPDGLRGSQPPAWCTPYLGFRPAAVRN